MKFYPENLSQWDNNQKLFLSGQYTQYRMDENHASALKSKMLLRPFESITTQNHYIIIEKWDQFLIQEV